MVNIAERELECESCRKIIYKGEKYYLVNEYYLTDKYYLADSLSSHRRDTLCVECYKTKEKREEMFCWVFVCVIQIFFIIAWVCYNLIK